MAHIRTHDTTERRKNKVVKKYGVVAEQTVHCISFTWYRSGQRTHLTFPDRPLAECQEALRHITFH